MALPFSPTARAFYEAFDSDSGSVNTSSKLLKKRIATLGWRNRYSQSIEHPIVCANQTFAVRQVQRGEVDGTYGTGATVWPAAIVLIKYLEKSGVCSGKRVVDLGSGTGATSIAAAFLGATSVVCTDGLEMVVQLARDNIARAQQQTTTSVTETGKHNKRAIIINGCPIKVQTYSWGKDAIESFQNPGIVIVADCVLPKLYPMAPLVDALDQLLQGTGVAILSYEHRHYPDYDPRDKFRDLCGRKNLSVTSVPAEEQDEVYSVDDIEIWMVERASSPRIVEAT
jgi:ribosomal protein L11 methylase PrmA